MAQDQVYAVIKRGDLSTKKRNMQIVDVIDMAEQEKGFNLKMEHMGKCFVVVGISKNQLDLYRQDKTTHYLDMVEVAKQLKMPDLISDMASKRNIPIIDGSSIPTEDLKSFEGKIFEPNIDDVMAITSGDYTVGSASDYATFTSALADVGTMDGLLRLLLNSNLTDGNFSASETQNGNRLEVTSNSKPEGDVTAGHVLTSSNTDTFSSASDPLWVHGLRIVHSGTATSVTSLSNAGVFFFDNVVRIVNGVRGINTTGGPSAYNNLIYDGVGAGKIGIIQLSGNGFYYNNTIVTCDTGIFNFGGDGTWRSIGIYDPGSLSWNRNGGAINVENCACSDTALPNHATNKEGLTSASEVNMTNTEATFGHPLSGVVNVATGGSTSHLNSSTAGQDGVAWDGSDPSIGFVQWAAAASGTIVPNIINYLRQRRAA